MCKRTTTPRHASLITENSPLNNIDEDQFRDLLPRLVSTVTLSIQQGRVVVAIMAREVEDATLALQGVRDDLSHHDFALAHQDVVNMRAALGIASIELLQSEAFLAELIRSSRRLERQPVTSETILKY